MDYWDRAVDVTCGSGPSEEDLKNAAWNAMGVAYNPDAALADYASDNGLGVPLCNEYEFTIDCEFYVGQVYVGDGGPVFVYCKKGDWDNITDMELA